MARPGAFGDLERTTYAGRPHRRSAALSEDAGAQNHLSIGGGFAWTKFQIDFAYDTSKYYKVGSLSMVARF
ncbi:MAG TPA: hypothetical protein VGK04_02910 [Thermoanaerobaculia bacterium]